MDNQTSATNEKLGGYVCPECRILFALPDGVAGNGALCPNCNSLLSIPLPDDGVDELGVSKIKYKQAGFYTKETPEETMIAKEKRAARHGRGLGEEIQWRWLIPSSLFAVLLLGYLSWLLFGGNKVVIADSSEPDKDDGMIVIDDPVGDAPETKVKDENKVYFTAASKEHEKLLEDFLTTLLRAEKVEDLLPLVRPVDRIEEKMRSHYAKHPFKPNEFKTLNQFGALQENLDMVFCRFLDKNFDPHQAMMLFENGRLLLDWEGYVAYSEMNWDELAEKKPNQPIEVRAQVNKSQFYNGQFVDDTKWQVVSLRSPNSERILYGYFEKGSAPEQALFQFGVLRNDVRATLTIRYPDNAESDRQVIIEDVIRTHWSDIKK